MQIDRSDASIELSLQEVDYLTGKVPTPARLLSAQVKDRRGSFTHTYPSFRDRVERVAEEIHEETDRTVLITDPDCKTIARYNQRGFMFDEDNHAT
jgi:hypothetical protein